MRNPGRRLGRVEVELPGDGLEALELTRCQGEEGAEDAAGLSVRQPVDDAVAEKVAELLAGG